MPQKLLRPFITATGRPRNWLFWLCGGYLVYCLLFGLAIPYIGRGLAEKELSKALQSHCTLKQIRFNPFTFNLSIEGLNIFYPQSEKIFFSFERIDILPQIAPLLRLTPTLELLTIVKPTLDLTLYADGKTSLDLLLPPTNTSSSTPSPAGDTTASAQTAEDSHTPGAMFPFIVNNLEIVQGNLTLHDDTHTTTHTIQELSVTVPFTSTLDDDKNREIRPTLTAVINGKPAILDGKTTPFADNNQTEFRLRLGQVPLEHFKTYLAPHTTLSLDKGELTAEIVLHVEIRKKSVSLGLAGTLYLSDVSFSAPNEGTVLSLDYGMLDLDRLLLGQNQLSITDGVLENLTVAIAREKNGAINWQRYFSPKAIESYQTQKNNTHIRANSQENVLTARQVNATAAVHQLTSSAVLAATQANLTLQLRAAHNSTTTAIPQTDTIAAHSLRTNNATAQAFHLTLPMQGQAATNATTLRQANATTITFQANSTTPIPQTNATMATGIAGETLPSEGQFRSQQAPDAAEIPNTAEATPFHIVLHKFSLHNGRVLWTDAAIPGGFSQEFSPIEIEVRDIGAEGEGQAQGDFIITLGEKSVAAPAFNDLFFLTQAKLRQQRAKKTLSESTEKSSSNATAMPQTNATAVLASNATAMPQANATAILASNATAMPQANATAILASNATAMPQINATAVLSTNATEQPVILPAEVTGATLTAFAQASIIAKQLAPPTPPSAHKRPSLPGGNLALRGEFTLNPFVIQIGIFSDAIPLQALAPYAEVAGVSLQKGKFEADCHIVIQQKSGSTKIIFEKGDLRLGDLDVDVDGVQVRARKISLAGLQLDTGTNTLSLGTLALQEPILRMPLPTEAATPGTGGVTGKKQKPSDKATVTPKQAPKPGKVASKPQSKKKGEAPKGTKKATTPAVAAPSPMPLSAATSAQNTSSAPAQASPTASPTEPPAKGKKETEETREELVAKEATAPKKEAGPLLVTVPALRITQGTLELTGKTPFTFSDLELNVTGASSRMTDPLQFTLAGKINKTGVFRVAGAGTVEPVNLRLTPVINKFPLQSLTALIRPFIALDIADGEFSCDLTMQIASPISLANTAEARANHRRDPQATEVVQVPAESAAPALGVAVTGQIGVVNLLLKAQQQEIFGFKQLHLTGLSANTAATTYDIASITLDTPRLDFTRFTDGMNSISRALDTSGEQTREIKHKTLAQGPSALEKAVREQEKSAQSAQSGHKGAQAAQGVSNDQANDKDGAKIAKTLILQNIARFTLEKFNIQKGSVRFRDEMLSKRVGVQLSNLSLGVTGLSSAPGSIAIAKLSGLLEGAPLSVDAKINPLFTPLQGSGSLSLKNMDLTSFSSYAEKFIAYPIEKGTLSLNTAVKTNGETIRSRNEIRLTNFTLGNKIERPDAPNLPIKLGLSILADSDNVISLSLPIAGRLDDPELRTGGIAMKAFGNILFKIVSSPFSLLGSLVGGSGETNFDYIPFAAGDVSITPPAEASIKGLIDLLKKRDNISVEFQGMADEREKDQIAQAVIHAGIKKIKWESLSDKEKSLTHESDLSVGPDVDAKEYERLLFEFYADQPFDKPSTLGITKRLPVAAMEQAIAKATPTTSAALEELAKKRAEAIIKEVVRQEPSLASRISIAPSGRVRESSEGAPLFARVELGAK